MAEKQDKQEEKQKPKATLIKHRKPDAASTEASTVEKKKVVVIKKKVVVKKTPAKVSPQEEKETKTVRVDNPVVKPRIANRKAAAEETNKEKITKSDKSGNRSEGKPRSPEDTGNAEKRIHGQEVRQPAGNRPGAPRRPGGYGGGRPGAPGRPGGYGDNRPGAPGRPGGYGDNRPGAPGRPGGYGGGRPGAPGRPGGYGDNRPGAPGRPGGYGGGRPGAPGRPGGYNGGRPGAPGRPGGYGGGRPGAPGRPGGYNGGRPGAPGRPGGYGGGRPGAPGRPGGYGGGRPGAPGDNRGNFRGKPQTTSEEKTIGKTPGKRFFKAKKKGAFQKSKKEQTREKNFQIKKKNIIKTNPVPKEIDIMEVITVSELAKKMNLKASELISKLMGMGMMVSINQQIDAETAGILAHEYGCTVKIVSLYDETLIERDKGDEEDIKARAPIVTIMGHVDHGKTKLLDAIRTTDVVATEFGGITQHIGAYKVELPQGKIVFLDTPGHEAFTLMRARGAQVTDIVILVVAANDGVMPQTVEAINHAKDAGVPIIVAINKMDLPEANPEHVKKQLSDYDLVPEQWGGKTLYVEISALKKTGIDGLLDAILLQAELLELKANYNCRAEGKVIESRVDHGRGIVSTVLIERGSLHVGDTFVAGVFPGKVRAMFNDRGQKISEAGPSTPVEILGFTGIPNAGAPFQCTENDKIARQVGIKRQELEKLGIAQNVKKITLDNLYDSIQEGGIQELKVIIKGDVHGSVEALKTALEKLSTKEIRLKAIDASAGAIVENDVNFASASNAIIVGFHVRPTPKAQALAEREKVDIRKYNIIYDAVEDIRAAMEGLLAPELQEVTLGTVEVRETFKVPKIGVIAGCFVKTGKVIRNATVHVYREGVEIHSGKINSLKRFKEDVREVASNYECGIGIDNFSDFQVGDELEVFEVKEIAKKLEKN